MAITAALLCIVLVHKCRPFNADNSKQTKPKMKKQYVVVHNSGDM